MMLQVREQLQLREDKNHGHYIQGASSVQADSAADAIALLKSASAHLAFTATEMNAHSSRSHAVCMISVTKDTAGARQPPARTPGGNSLASDVADLLSPGHGAPPDLEKWRHRSVEVISTIIEQVRMHGYDYASYGYISTIVDEVRMHLLQLPQLPCLLHV